MEVENSKEALEYVAGLALDATQAQIVTTEAEHFMVVPKDTDVVSLRQFQFAEKPARKQATVKVRDVAGFASYFNRFADPDSMVFGAPKSFTMKAFLDYHAPLDGEARNLRHILILEMEQTTRWKTWFGMNRQAKPQDEFASFIEDNKADIFSPDGSNFPTAADMVEIARSLEAASSYNFKQVTNLKNGERTVQYNEVINGVAGPNGELKIPDEFMIRLPIFLNQRPVEVTCRLRFRLSSGKLSMWFDMVRVDEMLAAEFEAARTAVEAAIERTVILGEVA